jgi:hypothetical protein
MDIAQAKQLTNSSDILGQHGCGGSIEMAVLRGLTFIP